MADSKELNTRQLRFVLGIIEGKDAKNAYIDAGYKSRGNAAEVSASKLLRNPKVAAFIEKFRQEVQEETRVTAERVIAELAKLGFSNMRRYSQWGPEGVTLRSSEELSDDETAAVSEVSETRTIVTRPKGETIETITVKFKLYDKRRALRDLGEHLGVFGKVGTGDDGQLDQIAEALEAAPDED